MPFYQIFHILVCKCVLHFFCVHSPFTSCEFLSQYSCESGHFPRYRCFYIYQVKGSPCGANLFLRFCAKRGTMLATRATSAARPPRPHGSPCRCPLRCPGLGKTQPYILTHRGPSRCGCAGPSRGASKYAFCPIRGPSPGARGPPSGRPQGRDAAPGARLRAPLSRRPSGCACACPAPRPLRRAVLGAAGIPPCPPPGGSSPLPPSGG